MRITVLTFQDPWHRPHGGTLRVKALVEAFAQLSDDVTCVHPGAGPDRPARRLGELRYPEALTSLKRQLLPMPTLTGGRSSQLERMVQGSAPDLLVVTNLAGVPYARLVPGARLWFDQSDVLSLFAAREAAERHGLPRTTAGLQANWLAKAEDRAVAAADVSTAAGYNDAVVQSRRTCRDTVWLPVPISVSRRSPRPTGSHTVGFLANFAYWPNRTALEVLLRSWLPELRRRGWRLLVAGLGSGTLDLPEDVECLGPVADVADFYARVEASVAPVERGGGMKVKIVESLLYDRPVMATPAALEGFPPSMRSAVQVVQPEAPDLGDMSWVGAPIDATPLLPFTPAHSLTTISSLMGVLGD